VRNTVVMLVLAILAAATWIATWERQGSGTATGPTADPPALGYYAHGTRILVTDEEGQVTAHVRADRLDELPDEQLLRLEGISVDYAPADETAWSISAARASAPKDGSLLDLAGDVEIRSMPTDGATQQTITTQALRFWPDTSNVESDAPVEIHIGDWRFRTVGLRMDLKGDTLRLESQVHGTFAPR
jgi:LPS export ABC transporter protein LptC